MRHYELNIFIIIKSRAKTEIFVNANIVLNYLILVFNNYVLLAFVIFCLLWHICLTFINNVINNTVFDSILPLSNQVCFVLFVCCLQSHNTASVISDLVSLWQEETCNTRNAECCSKPASTGWYWQPRMSISFTDECRQCIPLLPPRKCNFGGY